MGTKHSKSEGNMKTEGEEESDDESEILEVMQEEEYSEEGSVNLMEKPCQKGEVHKNYIPIQKLTLNLLKDHAESICHESVLHYIQLRAQLVVQIKVRYTSTSRPANDKFCKGDKIIRDATGYAWIYCEEQSIVPCPDNSCSEYKKGPHNVYRGILVTTNRHVIFDNDEARKAEVKFFYDDDEDAKVIKGHGIALREDLEQKDFVSLKIYHHCDFLFQKISDINEQIMKTWERIPHDIKVELEKHTIVISHPHGLSKNVTLGKLLDKEVLIEDKESNNGYRKMTRYTNTTCPGSSGAPVLTGLYWTNPFVHSSAVYNKISKISTGISYSY